MRTISTIIAILVLSGTLMYGWYDPSNSSVLYGLLPAPTVRNLRIIQLSSNP
jgi:hypothetical protein